MIIARRPNDFAQRNLLLQLVLGMTGVGRKLEKLVEHRSEQTVDADDSALLAILGALALHRAVESFVAQTPPLASADAAAAEVVLEDLLR